MPAPISARIELELSGQGNGWTDKTVDVDISAGIQWTRELPGDDPTDRVMATPSLSLALNNSACNSVGLEGAYSLGHTNQLAGFDKDTGIRVVLLIGEGFVEPGFVESGFVEDAATVPIWTGVISDVRPDAGKFLSRLSRVRGVGYIDLLARARLANLNVLQGVGESDVIAALIAAMAKQPRGLSIAPGPDTYDFALDLARGDRLIPLTEAQRVCQSSYGTLYEDGDGTLTYEPRNVARAVEGNPLTPVLALTEADFESSDPPDIEEERRDAPNVVKLTMAPRRVDGAAVVVAALGSPFQIKPGATVTVRLPYRDPNDRGTLAGAVSGISPTTPADYTLNSERDGLGTNLSSSANVTYTFGGTSVACQIENTAAVIAWVTKLQARAIGIYSQEEITVEKVGTTTAGEVTLTYDMPYQSEVEVLDAVAQWHLDKLEPGGLRVRRLPIPLSACDPDRALAIVQTPFSSIVSAVETVSGLDGTERFHLDGLSGEIRPDRTIWLYPKLSPAFAGPFIEFDADHLTTGGSHKDASSYVTASVTGVKDRLLLLWVESKRSGGMQPNAPTATGLGGTWVQVLTDPYDNTGDDRRTITLLRTMLSVTATGTITIDFGGQTQDRICYSAISIPDVDTGGTFGSAAIVQAVSASGFDVATLTATLAAFGSANNRPACAWVNQHSVTIAAESEWTTLGYRTTYSSITSAMRRDAVDLSCTATIPGASGHSGAIAVEVKKV